MPAACRAAWTNAGRSSPRGLIRRSRSAPSRRSRRRTLRADAQDGSIEDDLDWVPVKAGDFYYAPSGTIHAIGGGLTLIEVQQNSETTYRLYDYGSDRELHLEDGVAVSH